MKISVFNHSDDLIWIPVSKANSKNPARAFLPIDGVDAEYIYGFKAQPQRATYIKALQDVQHAYINKVTEVFTLSSGKEQSQKKHNWRHGRKEGSPLLSPSLGWVKIPMKSLLSLSSQDLEKVIIDSGEKYAIYRSHEKLIDPVLCVEQSRLDNEVERLLPSILKGKPKGQRKPVKSKTGSHQYIRDAAVVAWVLANSKGLCECCGNVAPFKKEDGQFYLEVHHVKRLADEGSDTIENTIAVCPNCHREMHFGSKSKVLVDRVYSSVGRLVRE